MVSVTSSVLPVQRVFASDQRRRVRQDDRCHAARQDELVGVGEAVDVKQQHGGIQDELVAQRQCRHRVAETCTQCGSVFRPGWRPPSLNCCLQKASFRQNFSASHRWKKLNLFPAALSTISQVAGRRCFMVRYRIAFCPAIGHSPKPFRKIDMKKLFVTMFCLGITAPLFAAGTNQLADGNNRVSYAIGMMTGHQWKQQDLGFDPDSYAQGIKDALAGGTMLLTQEEAQQTIDAFKKEFTAKQQQKKLELTAKNKTEGEAFLATNKLTAGIKLLSVPQANGKTSDLHYQIGRAHV